MASPPELDVRVRGLRKRYGDVTAVDGVDVEIARGEFFTMLGPSGSGKTTTLRVIAGFERPDEGTVELRGRDVSRLPPYARDVNTVFQDYALFPHMSVQENVEYGLRVKKVPRPERRRRAQEALELVRLGGYGGRKPSQLSGGQRQRVALARALVRQPAVLLLDDTTSALDPTTEARVLANLRRMPVASTVIAVASRPSTIALADEVVYLRDGVVAAHGTHDHLMATVDGYRELMAAFEHDRDTPTTSDREVRS